MGVILALIVILVVRMKHHQSVQLAEQKPSVASATPEPEKQVAGQELEIQQASVVTSVSAPAGPQAWTVATRIQEGDSMCESVSWLLSMHQVSQCATPRVELTASSCQT